MSEFTLALGVFVAVVAILIRSSDASKRLILTAIYFALVAIYLKLGQ